MSELLAEFQRIRAMGYNEHYTAIQIKYFIKGRYNAATSFECRSRRWHEFSKPQFRQDGKQNAKYIAQGNFSVITGRAIIDLRGRGIVCNSCRNRTEIGGYCKTCHDNLTETVLGELCQYLAAFIPFPPDEIRASIVANFNGFYPALSREKDNHVAYSRAGNISVVNHDRRVRLRLSRFLRRAFTQSQLSDHALDNCVRQLNLGEFVLRMKPFEIDDYRNCPIESCMTGGDCDKCTLYEDPKIQFCAWYLGETENAIMVARALLFTSDDGQTKFLARVYNDGKYLASDDVIAFRDKQASLMGAVTSLPSNFRCTVSHDRGDDMPYVDNLKVERIDCHTVRLGARGETCQSTDGTDPTSGYECENCGSMVDEDSLMTVYTSRRNTSSWCEICLSNETYLYDGEYYASQTGQTVTIPDWESVE